MTTRPLDAGRSCTAGGAGADRLWSSCVDEPVGSVGPGNRRVRSAQPGRPQSQSISPPGPTFENATMLMRQTQAIFKISRWQLEGAGSARQSGFDCIQLRFSHRFVTEITYLGPMLTARPSAFPPHGYLPPAQPTEAALRSQRQHMAQRSRRRGCAPALARGVSRRCGLTSEPSPSLHPPLASQHVLPQGSVLRQLSESLRGRRAADTPTGGGKWAFPDVPAMARRPR